MKLIISGVVLIILGLTGKFALIGTNSPLALVAAGAVLIIVGIIQIVRANIKQYKEQLAALKNGTLSAPPKKRMGWRIALFVLFAIAFLMFLIITIDLISHPNFHYAVMSSLIPTFIFAGLAIFMFLNIKKTKRTEKEMLIKQDNAGVSNA